MSDNLFPDNKLTVDDILKEVRAMRQNADLEQNASDSQQLKSSDHKSSDLGLNTKSLDLNTKSLDNTLNEKDKLKDFLKVDSGYKPKIDAKQSVDLLFGQAEEIKSFTPKRTAVILSPEEINKSAKLKNQLHIEDNKENEKINGFKIKDGEADELVNVYKLNKLLSSEKNDNTKFIDNQPKAQVTPTINEPFLNKSTDNLEDTKEIAKIDTNTKETDLKETKEKQIKEKEVEELEVKITESKDIYSSKFKTVKVKEDNKTQVPTPIENKVFEEISKVQKVRKTSRKINEIGFQKTEVDNKPTNEDVIEDYENIEDAEAIRIDLETKGAKISKRLTFSTIILILLSLLTLTPAYSNALPSFISPVENIKVYLSVNIVLFSLLILFNLPSILRGVLSLFILKPDIDTAIGVSTIAALGHSVYAFYLSDDVALGKVMLYTAVVALALVFNLIGKKLMISRAALNFHMVATTGIKQSCFVADEQSADIIAENCSVGQAVLTCSKSTITLKNFLKNAFCEDPADNMCQLLATIGFIASIATGGLIYYFGGNLMTALTATVAIITVCVPLTSLIATNFPLYSASKILINENGILSGFNSVKHFADTDCVAIEAEEIFPAGSIDLLSIKSIGDFPIDNMILDAASLAISAGGPLADVFDKMIEGRRKILLKAKEIFYYDNLGISGIVDGRKIKIGNREFMENGNIINLPDPELERRLRRNNSYTVYVSCDDELCGMFVVKYKMIDEDIAHSLENLLASGINLIIKTNDPNITPELIGQVYEVDADFIKIMPSHAAQRYDDITAPVESSDSALAHMNCVSGFFSSVVACKSLKVKILLATFLQTAGSILAMAAVIFFALVNNFNLITPHFIFAYQLAWSLLVIIIPLFKRL